ncbi:MAG TPA: HD domain-containing phosphohydrolase [Dehalococcoidia bacterium]|nr:HD domain-containing phosphohydrolase [Dehalococcoidia bacterium]
MDTPTQLIRVLLVEDNPADVAIATRILGRYAHAHFDVSSVSSADECIAALGEHEFDLVMLDYGLPGEDGLALLRRMKHDRAAPPIIMLTGQGDPRVAGEAMRAGAYDYFPKDSLSSEVLGRAAHQALKNHQLETQLIDEQIEGTEQVIFAMASAAELKDAETEGHLRRMSVYAVRLGQELRLDERDLLLLKYGGILHDIGKIGVSETILREPGPLSPDQWHEMRQHPLIGERICRPLRMSAALAPIVRHHHERWDGRGYVDGLAGEEIPLLARVISVVDAFDAMSADRAYRAALPLPAIIAEFEACAGSHWDPEITASFLRLLRRAGADFVVADRARAA